MRFPSLILAFLVFAASLAAQDPGPAFYQAVEWSPDGKSLTFTAMRDMNQKDRPMRAEIFIVRTDGSDIRKITNGELNGFYSSWGKGRIVFGGGKPGSRDSEVYIANADGSNLTQVTKAGTGRNSTPAISPDGKRIVFISNRDGGKHQIYIMNADGSAQTRLTKDDTTAFYNPVFSPDGKRIVYYAEKGDRKDQIWVMNADGSDQKLLTGGVGHNIFPAFSGDGKRIIFASSGREQGVEGSFIYAMNVDGSNLTKIGSVPSYYARFSPDGKKIAYITGKFPESAIYIANADGSGAARVTK
jgi:TolB protein